MKTINELEQEAKQARDDVALALAEVLPYGTGSVIADKLILASVAMAKYQFSLEMAEIGGDRNIQILPEVSQEARDSDGFIKWDGGDCPVDSDAPTIVKFRDGNQSCVPHKAGSYEWRRDIVERSWDIVAYKIVKGE